MFGKFYDKPVIDNNFGNVLLTVSLEISNEYLSGGMEPTNGKIIPKIRLAK